MFALFLLFLAPIRVHPRPSVACLGLSYSADAHVSRHAFRDHGSVPIDREAVAHRKRWARPSIRGYPQGGESVDGYKRGRRVVAHFFENLFSGIFILSVVALVLKATEFQENANKQRVHEWARRNGCTVVRIGHILPWHPFPRHWFFDFDRYCRRYRVTVVDADGRERLAWVRTCYPVEAYWDLSEREPSRGETSKTPIDRDFLS